MSDFTKKVLLNGIYADAASIDPAKHKYVGIFRPAQLPTWVFDGERYAPHHCPVCRFSSFGSSGNPMPMWESHFARGCFDTQQYVSLNLKDETCGVTAEVVP